MAMGLEVKEAPTSWGGKRPALFCDLARPVAELEVFGRMVVGEHGFKVHDARLAFDDADMDEPALRALRQRLQVARKCFSKACAQAREALAQGRYDWTPEIVGDAVEASGRPWDQPKRVRFGDSVHAIPTSKRHAVAFTRIEDGAVSFATCEPHQLHAWRTEGMFEAIFAALGGGSVRNLPRPETWRMNLDGPWPVTARHAAAGTDAEGVRKLVEAAMAAAKDATAAYEAELAGLPTGGEPTAFLGEDHDARDMLLQAMADGGIVDVACVEDAADWTCTMDGGAVAAHVLKRLIEARLVESFDGDGDRPWSWRTRTRYRLRPGREPDARGLRPRERSVRFLRFAEACPRRDDREGRECHHPRSGSGTCSLTGCPLTTPVYMEERGLHAREDPTFAEEHDGKEGNDLVVADHRNTERSFAWRYAATSRAEVLLNYVARAWAADGAAHLCEDSDAHHVDALVAAGWVERGGRVGDIGVAVTASAKMRAALDAHRAASA